jgi:endonuclease-3 related protein
VTSISEVLRRLDAAYDYSNWHWQPGTPPDLVCIGAVLVQHTLWSSVELAMARLRDADALSLDVIASLPGDQLAELLRPAGTPSVKAKRLLALAHLARDHGGLDALLSLSTDEL